MKHKLIAVVLAVVLFSSSLTVRTSAVNLLDLVKLAEILRTIFPSKLEYTGAEVGEGIRKMFPFAHVDIHEDTVDIIRKAHDYVYFGGTSFPTFDGYVDVSVAINACKAIYGPNSMNSAITSYILLLLNTGEAFAVPLNMFNAIQSSNAVQITSFLSASTVYNPNAFLSRFSMLYEFEFHSGIGVTYGDFVNTAGQLVSQPIGTTFASIVLGFTPVTSMNVNLSTSLITNYYYVFAPGWRVNPFNSGALTITPGETTTTTYSLPPPLRNLHDDDIITFTVVTDPDTGEVIDIIVEHLKFSIEWGSRCVNSVISCIRREPISVA